MKRAALVIVASVALTGLGSVGIAESDGVRSTRAIVIPDDAQTVIEASTRPMNSTLVHDRQATPVQSQKRQTAMSQRGRILGIGGIFFKSANQRQMQEWYATHLGLADGGHGVMLPWREKDNPDSEQMTVWSIFPGNTKYFEPSPASFMVNYIVDDLDALLDRLAKEGVRIDPKRQDESYGRFAWIYDPDGNKIELWQPLNPGK